MNLTSPIFEFQNMHLFNSILIHQRIRYVNSKLVMHLIIPLYLLNKKKVKILPKRAFKKACNTGSTELTY